MMPDIEPIVRRRSEEHTSELQSPCNLVCRLLLEKKLKTTPQPTQRPRALHRRAEATYSACPQCAAKRLRPGTASIRSRELIIHFSFFFFNDTATPEIYTLSLHDALPI